MKNFRITVVTLVVLVSALVGTSVANTEKNTAPKNDPKKVEHFHPEGKEPSSHTLELRKKLKATLPFEDSRDFAEAKKGFIAAPPFKKIMADAGHVAWDMESYEFLLEDKDYSSIHPSLRRQAVLNMAYGLYEVVPGRIYQVRGFDLANISFIKGDTGWIVFDPLTAQETARAALEFINEKLGKRPVVAVVYSHSHGDHFGGVHGVVNDADVRSGKVPIIAPVGFMQHAISENVYAGNAMSRRLQYQYGALVPRNPYGHVDQAIGKNIAAGNTGLIAPTRIVTKDFEEITIDGVKMVFQNTPNTEAPAEMNTWFPQFKAFWGAENITGTVHNIYTLRGALVRDALRWSKYINAALYHFGQDAEVMFASHSWPRFGNDRIQEVLRAQRDIYAHLNNQVLHFANQGVTINQIHNVYAPPQKLQQQWAARSYHGSEMHNSRGVINRYLGFWDANPATLIPLSPEDSAPLYVEMMGGAPKIMAKGKELFEKGKYLHATEILNKLVYAEPKNKEAKKLLADTFEQLGYQMESPSVRNSFLAAALELRSGFPEGVPPTVGGPDLIRAMPTEMLLDFIAIRMDSRKAEKMNLQFVFNLITPDTGQKFVVELSNFTLTAMPGAQAKKADLTLTINRADIDQMILNPEITLKSLVKSGKATAVGNLGILDQLGETLVQFTPDFEIMPGTIPSRNANKVIRRGADNMFTKPEIADTSVD